MVETVRLVGGMLVGLLVGRWWALAAPAAVGIGIAGLSEIDVPGWILGVGYALIGAVGVAVGVLVRRRLGNRP